MYNTLNKNENEIVWIKVDNIPKLNLIELNEISCVRPEDDETYHLIYCEPVKRYSGRCPYCGSPCYISHGKTENRFVHDISHGLIRIGLSVKTPRYRCNDCGATFVHQFEAIMQNHQFTKRLYKQLESRALNEPFAPIAAEYGISKTKVAEILIKHCKEREVNRIMVAPRVLGIDEKHIAHAARGIFVNIENGKLIEMTEDNKKKTIMSTIERMKDYDRNIEIVTMDMSSAYCNVVQECLPKAMIVIDRFHVEAYIYKGVEKIRKIITNQLKKLVETIQNEEEKRRKSKLLARLGKNIYLFRFKPETLVQKESRISLLTDICNSFEELKQLYVIKLAAENIYNARSREDALNCFNQFISLLPRDNDVYKPFYAFIRMFVNWQKFILNWFDDKCIYKDSFNGDSEKRYSNSTAEGKNKLFGALNNIGSGYSFETLRYKCIFYEKSSERPTTKIRKRKVYDFDKDPGSFMSFTTYSYTSPARYHYENEKYLASGDCADIGILLKAIESGELF